MHGITLFFESEAEMQQFMETRTHPAVDGSLSDHRGEPPNDV